MLGMQVAQHSKKLRTRRLYKHCRTAHARLTEWSRGAVVTWEYCHHGHWVGGGALPSEKMSSTEKMNSIPRRLRPIVPRMTSSLETYTCM